MKRPRLRITPGPRFLSRSYVNFINIKAVADSPELFPVRFQRMPPNAEVARQGGRDGRVMPAGYAGQSTPELPRSVEGIPGRLARRQTPDNRNASNAVGCTRLPTSSTG
jgi:hypothetical protein